MTSLRGDSIMGAETAKSIATCGNRPCAGARNFCEVCAECGGFEMQGPGVGPRTPGQSTKAVED